jgi:hypothetical protein
MTRSTRITTTTANAIIMEPCTTNTAPLEAYN